MSAKLATNDLEAFWMPFTANRQYKKAPRLFVSAEGMYFTASDGRRVLDGTSGLWCVNAGHCRPKIVEAIRQQAGELDFAGTFQMGHPKAFEAASKLVNVAPPGFDHVFFTNSGSESVETALKIALAYHRAKGNGAKIRLIGRERGYHGVNFGGMSVGGITNNRKMFGSAVERGRPHPPHPRPRPQRLQPRRARAWRRACRRPRASCRAPRCLDHRRRDRRACGLLGGRPDPAQGLPQAAGRDLRQARHPAHLR